MTIIGTDKTGAPIAVERGLLKSTVYRGTPKGARLAGLGDLAEGQGFNWNQLFQFVNANPIVQGLGAKIAGQGQGVVPIYSQGQVSSVSAAGPGFFGSINPLYLIAGAGAVLLLMMRR